MARGLSRHDGCRTARGTHVLPGTTPRLQPRAPAASPLTRDLNRSDSRPSRIESSLSVVRARIVGTGGDRHRDADQVDEEPVEMGRPHQTVPPHALTASAGTRVSLRRSNCPRERAFRCSRRAHRPDPRRDQAGLAVCAGLRRSSAAGLRVAGCSTSAMTRLDMNRAVRTGAPDRVTSLTSTSPRRVAISTRRPARLAITSYVRDPVPASTTISIRSPFTPPQCARRARIATVLRARKRLRAGHSGTIRAEGPSASFTRAAASDCGESGRSPQDDCPRHVCCPSRRGAIGGIDQAQVRARSGEEFGAEDDAKARHARDDFGVAVGRYRFSIIVSVAAISVSFYRHRRCHPGRPHSGRFPHAQRAS